MFRIHNILTFMSGINVMILSGRLSSWWKRGISNLSTGSIIHKRQICLKSSVILTLNMHTHLYVYILFTCEHRLRVHNLSYTQFGSFFFQPPSLLPPLPPQAHLGSKRSSMIAVTNEITCPKYTCIEGTWHNMFYALHCVTFKMKFVHTGLCFLLIFSRQYPSHFSIFWL